MDPRLIPSRPRKCSSNVLVRKRGDGLETGIVVGFLSRALTRGSSCHLRNLLMDLKYVSHESDVHVYVLYVLVVILLVILDAVR